MAIKNILVQGEAKNTYIFLERGLNIVQVCDVLAEKFNVQIYQAGNAGAANILVVESIKK